MLQHTNYTLLNKLSIALYVKNIVTKHNSEKSKFLVCVAPILVTSYF